MPQYELMDSRKGETQLQKNDERMMEAEVRTWF